MAAGEVYEGIDGLEVELSFVDPAGAARDLTGGTVEIVLKKPDGTTVSFKDASPELDIDDPATGVVVVTVGAADLADVGTYHVQGYLATGVGTYPSNTESFPIRRGLERPSA